MSAFFDFQLVWDRASHDLELTSLHVLLLWWNTMSKTAYLKKNVLLGFCLRFQRTSTWPSWKQAWYWRSCWDKQEAEKGKLCHSDIPPLTILQIITLSKHQLKTKYSNIWVYRVHSSWNHHTNWLEWWAGDPSESSPSLLTFSWPAITVTCWEELVNSLPNTEFCVC